MKVLFVINMEDLGFEEPLGVMYLSAVCQKHDHKVYAVENSVAKIEQKIHTIQPDILATSVLTASFSYLLDNVKQIKEKYDIPTVFGGPHVTFFPEEILRNKSIDYIFRGESDESFADFLNKRQRGEAVDTTENLVIRNTGNEMVQNPLKPLISDLDSLPFPDRNLFDEYPQFQKSEVRSLIASRGCPYNCSYCFNAMIHKMYKGLGKTVRIRSVDNIIEECKELKEIYNAKILHFFDDIFPYHNDWLDEFADKYPRKIGLPFFTNTRFTVCTEDYVKRLKEAGCQTLLIGVESGDEMLREKILNRKMSNKLMVEKSALIRKHGIKIYSQNIIGLPYGSFEKDLKTLKLNIDLKSDFSGAYLCQPYPKTRIEQIAKDAGVLDESYKIGRSFYYSSPLKLRDKDKIEKLRTIFALVVNFPGLFNYIHQLLKLPEMPLKIASSLLHGYKIKTVVLRYPMRVNVFLQNIKLFFFRRINSAFKPYRKKFGAY